MARIRTIKPEFFQHEGLAKCSPHARLLAIALPQLADRRGRIRYVPMQVHAHAFPWEASVKVPVLLGELESVGYLKKYQIDGRDYLWIVNFEKHQRITGKESHTESQLPEFKGGNTGETSGCFPEKHPDAQEREGERGKDPTAGSVETGQGKDQKPEYSDEFERAWKRYPKRAGDNPKRRAWRAWEARRKSGVEIAAMADGVERYRRWCDATGKTGSEHVKQAATFFGPDESFLAPWDDAAPPEPPKPPGMFGPHGLGRYSA